jgi:hypothetical protein
MLGLLMMAVLMGAMLATGLYDITLVGGVPAWTGLGLGLQAAVTEERPTKPPPRPFLTVFVAQPDATASFIERAVRETAG